ncbi:hypothetical protein Hdeb2414_s0011g00373071 [Helianthus debilis subsp. tardiflorus]
MLEIIMDFRIYIKRKKNQLTFFIFFIPLFASWVRHHYEALTKLPAYTSTGATYSFGNMDPLATASNNRNGASNFSLFFPPNRDSHSRLHNKVKGERPIFHINVPLLHLQHVLFQNVKYTSWQKSQNLVLCIIFFTTCLRD